MNSLYNYYGNHKVISGYVDFICVQDMLQQLNGFYMLML